MWFFDRGKSSRRNLSKSFKLRRGLHRIEILEARLALHDGDDDGDETWLTHALYDDGLLNATAANPPIASPAAALMPAAATPADVGQWGALQNWPIEFINAIMLPTGQVLGYDRTLNLRLWDPVANTFKTPANPGYQIFCTGMSLLEDGEVLITGGAVVDTLGLPYAAIYNPFLDTWTQLQNNNAGRWYPSSTVLSDGDVLVMSGDTNGNVTDPLPQVFDVATGKWRDLTNAEQTLSFYPRVFSAPNGEAFIAGPDPTSEYLDPTGAGTLTPVANRVQPDRNFGSAVMYAPGKILYVGGGSPATSAAEVIDLNAPNPAWRAVSNMAFARRNCNATLLPDGEVLVNGGNTGSSTYDGDDSLTAEIWNPTTETFRTVASEADIRWYHSTALLLPDGRVLSTSGDLHLTGQVYSPPYLFAGTQPTISSAPQNVQYGDTFFVGTPDAANITAVRWIRLGTSTHAQNWDQYAQAATFTQTAGGLMVSAPPVPDASPPGYYFLFIDKGTVPSVAKIIQVSNKLPTLTIADTAGTEGANGTTTNAVFTVNLSLASAKTVTVAYTTANGTATAGQDYTAKTGILTFAPLSTSQNITVPLLGDALNDPNETFTLTLSAPVNATLDRAQAQGLIRDFNSLPVLDIKGTTLTANTLIDTRVTEPNTGTVGAVFTVTLSVAPTTTPVTVSYATAGGTATSGVDFTAQSGILTFAVGQTQNSITVAVLGDTIDEYNESFLVNLVSATGATINTAQAVGIIYNDDDPPTANLAGNVSGNEPVAAGTTGNIIVPVTLTAPSGKTVVVPWITGNDGSATQGLDFVSQVGAVTFLPGETTKNLTVSVLGDGIKEPNETFSIQMQSELDNANYGNRYTSVTIVDANTTPTVSVASASVTEGNTGTTNMVFTATLSAAVNQQVTVAYATTPGTATANTDYTTANGNITFAANTTTQTITVQVKGDTTVEGDETFNLTLSNPTNATLGSAQAVGTIIDDDASPAPAAPANLTAVAGFAAVKLTWQGSGGATSYSIYRGTSPNGEGTTPVATGVTGVTYTDTGLKNSANYYYFVKAVKLQGGVSYESQASNEVWVVPDPINYVNNLFGSSAILTLNGYNVEDILTFANSLQLTDGGTNQHDSAFTTIPVNVTRFTNQFTFQQVPSYKYTDPLADGMTFTIQGAGPTALGGTGGALGYAGIANSVAIKFDLADNTGEGPNSTGLYTGGAQPTGTNSINLNGTGIDLHSGDPMRVSMVYDGTTLTVTITDTVTLATATQNYTVNIPTLVGGNTAYIGFTGGTGTDTAIQKVTSWTFTPAPAVPTALQITSSSAAGVGLSWTNNDINATSVVIERKTGAAGTYAQIGATTTAAANTYTDNTVVAGNTYYYRVRASNNGSTSVPSNEVNTTIAGTAVDLQITNTDGQTTIAPGAAVTYTVVVTNASAVTVTGATVADTLPATLTGLTYTAVTTGGATGFTANGTGNLNNTVTMPAGSTITYTIHATLSAAATGTLANTATVTAPAGVTDSNLANNTATDSDTINAVVPTINFPNGFTGAAGQFSLNGAAAKIVGANLQLTDGGLTEGTSAFYLTPVNVTNFTTQFNFQLTNPQADGMTFTIQGVAPTAVGGTGGALGYASILKSAAVKFDIFDNTGEGNNSTGLFTGGVQPNSVGSISLAGSGIDLHSGHVMNASMTYNGTTLAVTITDTVTLATATQNYTVNIPTLVGGNTAYVGFTGGTGGLTATQSVLNWTYSPAVTLQAPTNLAVTSTTATQVGLSWTNNDINATSVVIERKTGAAGTYAQIGATTIATANTYTDNTVAANTTYYYRVRATNGSTVSAYSNEVNTTTPAVAVDLQITNTDGQTTIAPGAAVTYTVVVTNASAVTVTGATVADTLPATLTGLTYTAVTTGGATGFTANGTGNLNNTVTMPAGSTITYTIHATLSAAATGTLANTATVTAPAGVTDSNLANNTATDSDTINAVVPTINFPNGFTGAAGQFSLNGAAAKIVGANLQLTDGGLTEGTSAFYLTPVNVTNFTTQFNFQLTNPQADGMTFTIQGVAPTAVGGTGGALGYASILKSAAVKFDIFDNTGEGNNSTGLFTGGVQPNSVGSISLAGSGIDLHSGHVMNASMTYNGTTLAVTITDTVTLATATQNYTVNIPTLVGGNTAYVGFTGGTGGLTATQSVLNWTYSS